MSEDQNDIADEHDRAPVPGEEARTGPTDARGDVAAQGDADVEGSADAEAQEALRELEQLIARLGGAAEQLRSGDLSTDAAATLVEECAVLANRAGAELDRLGRAGRVEDMAGQAGRYAPAPGQDSLL
ncbi:MAG TPA: hypothetical protein VMU32_04545 [Solirubrobacteraceae bacterium]|nr:hypothetical protein [Solirubrobacteraceae bacterium]